MGLDHAFRSLDSLDKRDLQEMRCCCTPPPLVALTLEAVCVMLQEKPDWHTSKRLMWDSKFLIRLQEYDKDNIPPKIRFMIKRYLNNEDFVPDRVRMQSIAASALCCWVRAMDVYGRVAQAVEP